MPDEPSNSTGANAAPDAATDVAAAPRPSETALVPAETVQKVETARAAAPIRSADLVRNSEKAQTGETAKLKEIASAKEVARAKEVAGSKEIAKPVEGKSTGTEKNTGTELVRTDDAPAAPAVPTTTTSPPQQLSEVPKDELAHLAEEYGLDPTRYRTRQLLVAALHDRRQLIAGFPRDAMLDVVRWGRRPVTINASREQIAQEIIRIKSMRFAGLSQRGLIVLARLRGIAVKEEDTVPMLVKKLKKKEGFFARINRKRRTVLGSMISNLIGETESATDYKFLPAPGDDKAAGTTSTSTDSRPASIKEEIEESGLFGGITNRIKKTADQYLNQKLDEVEARIDRKLDEIDRRLAEWRDKEVANRIKILKITLWASVIVGVFSLIYSYVKVYFVK